MKRTALIASLFALLSQFQPAFGQTSSFSMRADEIRGLVSDDFAKPNIPEDAIAPDPNNPSGPRPLYLVYRYYSCLPWYRHHILSFYSSCPGFDTNKVVVDTANDTPELQLVNEENESLLGLSPGTAYLHPAYGLYCLKVTVPVYWDQWLPNIYHQFYLRFHYNAPYICWWEHWWYYWRSPLYVFQTTLSGLQEVPINPSPGTGFSTALTLDPIYNTLGYDIRYQNLQSGLQPTSNAHIHGPAGEGTNAGVLFPLNGGVSGSTSGRLFGATATLSPTQISQLRNGLMYVNLHTLTSPGGEIRGQIFQSPGPVYCPWRPCWSPLLRWGRGGPLWCLTVTHPYGWGWDPWYRPRNFCLYGLRYYFLPIGPYLRPGGLVPSGLRPPGIAQLNYNYLSYVWNYYPYIPNQYYWPYSTYCARWYWWQCLPFVQYRWCPPIVQFATYVNPDPLDVAPIPAQFPMDPDPNMLGTVSITSARAVFAAPGDVNGDGLVNLQDHQAFREQQNDTSASFFDVFATDIIPP